MNQPNRKTIETTVLKLENYESLASLSKDYLNDDYIIYVTGDSEYRYDIEIIHQRQETDEEYNTRVTKLIEREENAFKVKKQRDYQEYLKLKAEFEGNESN